jgi:hypothetical protein
VAYNSNESGESEVFVRQFPGSGGKWRVSTGGGQSPVWSKKGRELFYRGFEGIMVVGYTAEAESFVAGKPRLWAAGKDLSLSFDLARDEKRIAVLQDETVGKKEQPHVVFLLNFFDELRRRAPAGK